MLPAEALQIDIRGKDGNCGLFRPFVKGWQSWSDGAPSTNAKVVVVLSRDDGSGYQTVAANNPARSTTGVSGKAETEASNQNGKGYFRGVLTYSASFYTSAKTETFGPFQCK